MKDRIEPALLDWTARIMCCIRAHIRKTVPKIVAVSPLSPAAQRDSPQNSIRKPQVRYLHTDLRFLQIPKAVTHNTRVAGSSSAGPTNPKRRLTMAALRVVRVLRDRTRTCDGGVGGIPPSIYFTYRGKQRLRERRAGTTSPLLGSPRRRSVQPCWAHPPK